MTDAVISPLFVLVTMDRAVIGFVRNGQVGIHSFVRLQLRQYDLADLVPDGVSIVDIDLHAHCVIAHLADLAFADDVEALDHLDRCFPIPYVRRKLEVLGTHVVKCKTHNCVPKKYYLPKSGMVNKVSADYNQLSLYRKYDIAFRVTVTKMRCPELHGLFNSMKAPSRFNPQGYLERIGAGVRDVSVDAESLRRLQRSHLLSVPFENLDIYWKRPITIDVDRFFEKIVIDRRGGFCYELNGLFNELLRSLDFETRLVSARVFNGSGYGPEFDHAAILIRLDGDEYLADVGFGDFTTEPLRFELDVEQNDAAGIFMIRSSEGEYFEVAKRDGDEWRSEYIFSEQARRLSDFEEVCAHQQYSPDSHFTKGALCSLLTDSGRKTLTDKKLIKTIADQKHEQPIGSESEFYNLLKKEFGIELPGLTERS